MRDFQLGDTLPVIKEATVCDVKLKDQSFIEVCAFIGHQQNTFRCLFQCYLIFDGNNRTYLYMLRCASYIYQELSLDLDLVYNGGFQLAVDVDMMFGKSAYLSVKVTKMVGKARLTMTRLPYTHWSFAFVEVRNKYACAVFMFSGRPVPFSFALKLEN